MSNDRFGRRSMILGIPGVLAAQQRADDGQKKKEEEEEVSPAEDLMREHGVLKGALLVYSECANTLLARVISVKDSPPLILIRLLVGAVFVSEGIQKFLFPNELGVGRFMRSGYRRRR